MPAKCHDHAAGPPEGDVRKSHPPPPNPYARSRPGPGYTVVEVLGEIDMATAGALGEQLDALTSDASDEAPQVVVDLRRVDFFDCSGLRELCRAERRARERGGGLRLVSDQPRIHRLLRACGLLGRFPPLAELPPPAARENGAPQAPGK
ncbi:anti-sigma B factor antagonist [Streptomyces sp. V3I8]|uniref:STAS domain-containing protein n=1 Tax=Streptomyces sp. V3I8 TaxID=3042279 RepID=UPI002787E97F|nr:STAS domain-containing protein [Streptomyces sp. V3I8]MDQ1034381.1 anti-sigma B factor antagonist [Streptomyces sp. V3I8]